MLVDGAKLRDNEQYGSWGCLLSIGEAGLLLQTRHCQAVWFSVLGSAVAHHSAPGLYVCAKVHTFGIHITYSKYPHICWRRYNISWLF